MRIIMTVLIAISFSLIYPQESKKIQIEIQEVKEEVPFYRTFKIIATNPNPEKRTITGRIEFETGDICNFYFELNENENKEQIRHCKVKKYRSNYKVIVEKVFPFVVQE
ncbi:MAG: hypothetical protein N2247_12695 [Leptospiraceae bacterium]|jgi:hypothetical protein|nr:hypothetical protein [Leptospiraceae bacterium]